ncbi:MAG: alpha/beta fold hydrolase [Terrimicrobiaceae bacterium]|nr:alpha/beta fold hydrolase [Terrimicrobiaceae bacterium]
MDPFRWTILLAAALVLTGCQSPPTVTQAERINRTFGAIPASSSSSSAEAVRKADYRTALAAALPAINAGDPQFFWRTPAKRNEYSRGQFSKLRRADSRRAPPGLVRDGLGLPVIGIIPGNTPNAPSSGFLVPATLVATPASPEKNGTPRSQIRLFDSLRTDRARIDQRAFAVARNLEAVIEKAQSLGPGRLDGWKNFLNAHRLGQSRLTFFQPFDPDKIPVVLVHGLFSTPQMWANVVRALWADPGVRDRFQFWMFYYPTGQPIPASALELRQELDAVVRNHGRFKPAILVGHSMGGLLARTLVSGLSPDAAERIVPGIAGLPANHRVRQSLIFEPRTDVRRVIFLMTPHQGSRMALTSYSALGMRLTRFPDWLGDEIRTLGHLIPRDDRGRLPTSIHGLSPDSQFLSALRKAPMAAPYHSIIGIRSSRSAIGSSDGVVTYESAHVPGAESELLVPSGHGGHTHPMTLAELHRILALEK